MESDDKPKSYPSNGLYFEWRVFLKVLSQAADEYIHTASKEVIILSPNLYQNGLASYQLIAVFVQEVQ